MAGWGGTKCRDACTFIRGSDSRSPWQSDDFARLRSSLRGASKLQEERHRFAMLPAHGETCSVWIDDAQMVDDQVRRSGVEKPDHQHCGLLRPRNQWPRRCASEPRDECAPLHWINSSAIANSVSGIVRPSALAVLRLTMRLYLVGCTTGRSAGVAPLRIRPA
jgi:hypothetical protein